jgi:hypothetical protein
MADRLFATSRSAAWQNLVQRAVADVNRIDRRLFSDPGLGGELQKIIEKYSVEIARLDTNAITADPAEDERFVNDFFGDRRVAKIKRLRARIPFTGEAESLKIAPSRSTIPSHGAEIGKDALTITIADDDNADREVTTFCNLVQSNLDTLRQEYERDKPQLEQAVSQAAERRKAQIALENEQDSKRSFTVRR